ncbi:efflux RND transporter permease subunit [Ectothiorhodospiraceae bacterium BW-2]|nr:efflux RND transporter permease subunit [Ectothiorhodospiraceae bacterium BW-2]
MLQKLFQNQVLANLLFVLVLVMGTLAYLDLPRQQDPEINFNWINITTLWPGAAASDVEKLLTDPLEEAISNLADIRFVDSNSRQGLSSILVRFDEIDERTFDKRLNDLRREVQNKQRELPTDALDPVINEITTANAFPTAMVVVTAPRFDDNLRRQGVLITKDLKRLPGVNGVTEIGLPDPELQVNLIPERLTEFGLSPIDIAHTVSLNFRDIAAGDTQQQQQSWLIRVLGTSADPAYLGAMPIATARGEIRLDEVAEVVRAYEDPTYLASYQGQPALFFGITKKSQTNTLDILADIKEYLETRNQMSELTGVRLILADDQTIPTRHAIEIMQNNALIGLLLVVLVTWIFLGSRISLLVSIGIPFILAATFWILAAIGQTLNQSILLGVVIALGMLVDDAVVMAEAIYYRLQRGVDRLQAAIDSLKEIFAPITAAVLTTIAAFLPLMLLPGILGQFMMVIPLVVTLSLAISLIEAYWILPAHVVAQHGSRADRPSRLQPYRTAMTHWIRIKYTRLLLRTMRWPRLTLISALLMFIAILSAVSSGVVKMDFFASDPIRLFYITIEMEPSTPLAQTLQQSERVERVVRHYLQPEDARAVVSYAGIAFTETAPLIGEHYGQIMVSLLPEQPGMRSVDQVMESMRSEVLTIPGAVNISFVRLAGGPPVEKPVKIKVRGDDYDEIRQAADRLKAAMFQMSGIKDISDDAVAGRMELRLRPDYDTIRQVGLNAETVRRTLRLLTDGEALASVQYEGEKWPVRVRGRPANVDDIGQLLQLTLPLPGGGEIALRELVQVESAQGVGNIRHYNFRRAITIEADIDKKITDEVAANGAIIDYWERELQSHYPNLAIDTSGALDDINEALDNIIVLFMMGVGIMYIILGTQFNSYFQPLAILVTVPLAFTGVVLGLIISNNPLSLYTLYGVVALAGIAVNSAIVLISAANDRLAAGMSLLHATLYAARRRVIPILITSLTTIAGLFSLATGLGGKSLVWGPVATAIVWGLAFSTLLTLFVIPVLYRITMSRSPRLKR